MAQSEQRGPHRSFTVRVPEELYIKLGDLADAEGVYVNTKVNELIRLGLAAEIDLTEKISQLLKKEVING
jgi:predicted HicB family RNase H-like nuclease